MQLHGQWDRRRVSHLPPDKLLRLQVICGHWRLGHILVTQAHQPCWVGRGGGWGTATGERYGLQKHPRFKKDILVWKILPKVTYLYHYQSFIIHPTLQWSSRATLISQNLCRPSANQHSVHFSCSVPPETTVALLYHMFEMEENR